MTTDDPMVYLTKLVHDLSTPLSTVILQAQLGLQGCEGTTQGNRLATILENARAVQTLLVEAREVVRAEDDLDNRSETG